MRKSINAQTCLIVMYVSLATIFVVFLVSSHDMPLPQNNSAQTQEQNQSSQLESANITGDLTQATGGNVYGGEKMGEIKINSDGQQINIKGLINSLPTEGNEYEAWLQDAGGSEYKLSLGRVMENGTIDIEQDMVNPFTYTLFFITEEP